ncbi:hypothetical protein NHP21005_15350 [Helicobacter sp. NHP21005]|uniref:tetratricopeptide repeat protein n=1 Tax=Helicobacter felistomachi TaxID=3040201 RepID=UPI002573E0C2|nr:tetratricopeptide repeat protein [Helicobacter sp. NHP21005]BEG57847.1 hypothetical protein NHP21005_15350 [Helicobacter sp. NHP21005]
MIKTKEANPIEADGGTEGIVYLSTAKVAYHNKDYAKAAEYYLKAGEAGEAMGYYELGGMYCCGQEMEKDFVKAFECFQKAALMGDARAHHALGVIYEYGHGRAQDIAKAKEHYQKAADMGDFIAQTALDRMHYKEH